jgi:hypothetical protein
VRYSLCMNPVFRFIILLVYLSSGTSFCFSQEQDSGVQGNIGTSRRDTVPDGSMPLDTAVPVSYVLIGNDKKMYTEADSATWQTYNGNPLGFGQAHLGNLGSAYRSLQLNANQPIGFSTGWLQYEDYYPHEETFKYYDQVVPVAKIRYDQAGRDDTHIALEFGKSFAKGTSLSLSYKRTNQVGEFAHQHQKDTGLGIGIWHNSNNGKYDAFYNLISSSILAEENGGIVEPDSVGRPLRPDNSLATFITGGMTKHKHRIFLTKQIFHLSADTASVGIDFWLKAKFETGLYKYVDETAAKDSIYYDSIFQVDDRGIRQYTYTTRNEESVGVSLPWAAAHSRVEGSLRYSGTRLEQEPVTKNINEIFFDASGEFQWVEPLTLGGVLSIGLGQAEGTYSFKAFGDLKLGILGHLEGHWFAQSRKPYLMESTLYVDQLLIYNYDYKNPFSTEIGVAWKNEKQQWMAGIKWLVYDNYIYFDSIPLPRQLSGSFSQKQFYVSKGFDFKWFGGKGAWVWQPDTKAELALPENSVSADLFGRIRIFDKRVMLMPGFDLTYYSQYPGVSYFPVNGIYHLTGHDPIPDYVRVDAGLGLNINFIKAYIRMEDIAGLFKDRALYQADFYPHYRAYFRFGLTAEFFN